MRVSIIALLRCCGMTKPQDRPDIGMLFGTDDEVLFPSNSKFAVHNKYFDSATGRIVIQMVER